MIEKLKKLNPDLKVYSVNDREFKEYGTVLDFDATDFVKKCMELDFPSDGSEYIRSVKTLENAEGADELREALFGGCPVQIGICHGYNTKLNALEYHNSSEINIAAKPLILLLAKRSEMEDGKLSADKVKAFYLEKGETVEVFATSLHFCPCQVLDEGFSAVVVLPEGTNADLEKPALDQKLLFRKNKWIICHEDNIALRENGVYPGIYGTNYTINY